MNIFLSKRFLEKAVKKTYVVQLTDEIQKLVNENEELKAKLARMTIRQEELERKLVNNETQLKSPEYECAVAIRNMMQSIACYTVKSETPEIVRKQIKKLKDNTEKSQKINGIDFSKYEDDPFYGCNLSLLNF